MIKALAVGIIALGMLAGCDSEESNFRMFSIEDQYDFADIRLLDGSVKTVRVKEWTSTVYNDVVIILDTDGVVWRLHSNNVIMYTEAAKDEDATR